MHTLAHKQTFSLSLSHTLIHKYSHTNLYSLTLYNHTHTRAHSHTHKGTHEHSHSLSLSILVGNPTPAQNRILSSAVLLYVCLIHCKTLFDVSQIPSLFPALCPAESRSQRNGRLSESFGWIWRPVRPRKGRWRRRRRTLKVFWLSSQRWTYLRRMKSIKKYRSKKMQFLNCIQNFPLSGLYRRISTISSKPSVIFLRLT